MSAEDDTPGARYAGFWAKLDCDGCGDEIEVEGDVSNGEEVECVTCGVKRKVYGR